jgi:hypothetical protein
MKHAKGKEKENQRRFDVNRIGDLCYLPQYPTSCPMTHDPSPILISLNKSITRFIHPDVLSNISLSEPALFIPDIFLKYEI